MSEEKGHSTPMAPSVNEAASCVLIQGWLEKKSRYIRRWRNRWIMMTQKTLCTYKDANDLTNPTEIVDLTRLIHFKINDDSFDASKNKRSNQKYIFEITIDNDITSPYVLGGGASWSNANNNGSDPDAEGSVGNKKINHTQFSFSAPTEKQAQSWIKQFQRILTVNKSLLVLPKPSTPSRPARNVCNHNHHHKNNEKSNTLLSDSHPSGSNRTCCDDGKHEHRHNNNNNHNSCDNSLEYYKNESIPNYGCQHYRRNCYIKSKCCNRWYFCSYCHDVKEDKLNVDKIIKSLRNESENDEAHTLDRGQICRMTCVHCGKEQKPSNYCINPQCGIRMAKYYCHKCKFWNNDPNCELFHCDGCGVCRTGNRDDYQHCDKCGVCLTKAYYATHKCIEQATQCDCPICGDFLHRSDKPVTFWPNCGHGIHVECMNEYLKFDSLCSVCRTPWVPDLSNLANY